jgi:hypothetical protein
MVRAKFKVDSKTETVNGKTVKLQVVAHDSPENKSYFKWTPNGTIEMGILNPEASEQFEVGKEYYVDFIKA